LHLNKLIPWNGYSNSGKLEPTTAHNQQFGGIKLSQASTKPHYGNQKKALKKC